jgi:release factor glutamine methyltransferase
VESPHLDAEVLLGEATGWDRAELAAHPEAGVSPGAARAFGEIVRRRLRREPVAYILGRRGFRRIDVKVDRRVLIPRPETELLVEVAVELRPDSVVDVGTGSGAVALAVAAELSGAAVTATDTSPGALEVARSNALRLGLADRVRVLEGTIPAGRRFDLVLANLPYVADHEWATLPPEIREWEPREALVAGRDGLDAIRGLLAALVVPPVHAGHEEKREIRVVEPPATIAVEIGSGQAPTVTAMLDEAGYPAAETRRDLAGIERVVVARR